MLCLSHTRSFMTCCWYPFVVSVIIQLAVHKTTSTCNLLLSCFTRSPHLCCLFSSLTYTLSTSLVSPMLSTYPLVHYPFILRTMIKQQQNNLCSFTYSFSRLVSPSSLSFWSCVIPQWPNAFSLSNLDSCWLQQLLWQILTHLIRMNKHNPQVVCFLLQE